MPEVAWSKLCATSSHRYSVGGESSLSETAPLLSSAKACFAAAQVGKAVDLASLWQTYQQLSAEQDLVLIEGVGGLGCPLTWDYTIADLAHDWRVNAVLVAPIRLGAIGQLVASVGYARKLGLKLSCIILSQVTRDPGKDLADRNLIENLCQLPVMGVIPYLEDAQDLEALAHAAAGLWLEVIGWGTKR